MPTDRRLSQVSEPSCVDDIKNGLMKTVPLWITDDTEQVMTNQEELKFPQSMKTDSRLIWCSWSGTGFSDQKESRNPPTYASLQWDSTQLGTLMDKNVNEERITVAVGNVDDIELLGVPTHESGTDRRSEDIIEKALELLKLGNC